MNLIGDHTDYTGGLVLPMAIRQGTTVTGRRGGRRVTMESADRPGRVEVDLPVPDRVEVPDWGRLVVEVARRVGPPTGITARLSSDLPIGAGLSSSGSLEVAVALALGHPGPPLELALLCRDAEERATGVPCGLMDQLASARGVEGCALLIDCSDHRVQEVPLPGADEAEIVVVHSGEARRLAGSAYADRRRQCEQAAQLIGPLGRAGLADLSVEAVPDPVLRARARHVISENQRVRDFTAALAAGDLTRCGRLMVASHRSLATDFEVSTPRLDQLVDHLCAQPGVFGARLTGAGFGGCVVALTRPGALSDGWTVRPSAGARLLD